MCGGEPHNGKHGVSVGNRYVFATLFSFEPMKIFVPLSVGILALFFGSFRAKAETPEQQFWKWFQDNDSALFDFERDQERVFDRLAKELHKVNPDLVFEFGPKKDGRRDFVISADGIRQAFPAVESLFAAAPPLPRWRIIEFRPRRTPHDISIGGLTVKASSVRVHMVQRSGKVDLVLFIPEYSADARDSFLQIVYLLLDEALGEYDVETYVGFIDVQPVAEALQDTYSLEGLPSAFDSAKARIVH